VLFTPLRRRFINTFANSSSINPSICCPNTGPYPYNQSFFMAACDLNPRTWARPFLFQAKATVRAANSAGLDAAVRRFADAKAGQHVVHH
jgi:hypothetical protein